MRGKSTVAEAVITWMEWGPAVFELAGKQDKLVLLDSGAKWCHWCHVMDHETYEDPDVVRAIHDRYISVRIDRDRLPEIDAFYQRAVPIIDSQAGGWPLTVILTPEGDVLFKATFVPPQGRGGFGDVGMVDLLFKLDEFWRSNRGQLREAERELEVAVVQRERATHAGGLDKAILKDMLSGLARTFDSLHGGFGEAPKFFHPAAIEFLLAQAWRGNRQALDMARATLEGIARGGVYDHVGGGFHRYSVDARWHVPHFEKMAYDNAAMLANYANAFALAGWEDFAEVGRQTIGWINRSLLDPRHRGFYASQDADVGPDDDGDYFTWTADEFRRALGSRAELAVYYFDITPAGDLHGRPGRNVLHVPKTIEQTAKLLARPVEELRQELAEVRKGLSAARQERKAPAVDTTIFADLSGMMIDAYLTAWQRLGEPQCRQIALEVLDNLLDDLRDDRGVFAHYRDGGKLVGVGLLADQAWMLRALLGAFAAGTDTSYLRAAGVLADYILSSLMEADGTILGSPKPKHHGPADVPPTRGWEDNPSRNPGTVACEGLLQLGHLLGRNDYIEPAVKALGNCAGLARPEWATMLGGFALAADTHLNGPRRIVVSLPSDDAAGQTLLDAARKAYVPGSMVLGLDSSDPQHQTLLEQLAVKPAGGSVAYVCHGKACLEPARSLDELRQRIRDLAGE